MKKAENRLPSTGTGRVDICSYGVRVRIEADLPNHIEKTLERLPLALADRYELISEDDFDFRFYLKRLKNGYYRVYRNKELLPSDEKTEENVLDFFLNQLRLTVGEYAVDKVFIHAGVVGWRGEAIVLPGKSFAGKTTLVAELIKRGALYFSDEYAVLDQEGLVHPFPRMLGVRGLPGEDKQKEVFSEDLGAVAGTRPIPVGVVMLTEFSPGSVSNPEVLTPGQAILEIIPHTLPIRSNPEFALKVLNKSLKRAKIAKTKRGEAADFAEILTNYAN